MLYHCIWHDYIAPRLGNPGHSTRKRRDGGADYNEPSTSSQDCQDASDVVTPDIMHTILTQCQYTLNTAKACDVYARVNNIVEGECLTLHRPV